MNEETTPTTTENQNIPAKADSPVIPVAPPALNIPQPTGFSSISSAPDLASSPLDGNLENPKFAPANQNPFKSKGRNKRWLVGGLIALLIFLGVGVAFWYSNSKKAHLLIEYSDISKVTISLNGSTVKGSIEDKSIKINTFPGRYRLTISQPDYSAFTQDVDLTQGQTLTIKPAFALFPKTLNTTSEQTTTIDYARLSKDGNSIFFLGYNRQIIYRMDIKSRVATPLTTNQNKLIDVKDIQWSGNPDLAIVKTGDGTYFYEIPKYDFEHQVYLKKAGPEVISPIWDPNDTSRIALVYAPSTGEYSLVFTDKYFSNFERKPADISGISNPKLYWSPDSGHIAILDQGKDKSKNNIWLYNTADGSLAQITQLGGIGDLSFSLDGKSLIYENVGSGNTSRINGYSITNNKLIGLNLNAKISQAAWRDGSSFYIPDRDKNLLTLNKIDGSSQSLNYTFDDSGSVQGMFYSAQNKFLIFYTNKTIFTIDLSMQ